MTKGKFLVNKGINPSTIEARHWKGNIWKGRMAIQDAMKDRAREEPDQLVDLFAAVQQWSLGLAPKHYNASQMLRMHAELLMEKSIKIENGTMVGTTLKPSQLSQLATVLATCQKMDRLACGLSTENVAANVGGASGHVEKSDTQPMEDKRGPVFVVEVSVNGKFVRPRPRMELVQQIEAPKRIANGS